MSDLELPLHQLACDRWAEAKGDDALIFEDATGRLRCYRFEDLESLSRRLALSLFERGVRSGDRVAVVSPQHPSVPVVYLAVSRLGAIGVPLSPLFGREALASRLADAAPRVVFAAADNAADVRRVAPSIPVEEVSTDWLEHLAEVAPLPTALESRVGGDAPLFLVYTSGTTGGPKGALLPHRVIPGRLPGFRLAHDGVPEFGDLFWSPADWAWIGGLHDALFAPWALGLPVYAYERGKGPFDPARAYRSVARAAVRNAFLPPTALRAFMRSGLTPPSTFKLRTLHTAGEPLPAPVFEWVQKTWNVTPIELYGLTECAFVVGNAPGRVPPRPGVTGFPYPGESVEILRRDGVRAAQGETGEICVRHGSPTMMLGYWQGAGRPLDLPLDKGWLRTGDLAVRAPDGAFVFKGRKDDVIKTSGYRVGPAEVESVLLSHAAVAEAAVVGAPDVERGHVIVAFVSLSLSATPSDALKGELSTIVRAELGAHAYPREIVFVDELPKTTSGKILRAELRRRLADRKVSL